MHTEFVRQSIEKYGLQQLIHSRMDIAVHVKRAITCILIEQGYDRGYISSLLNMDRTTTYNLSDDIPGLPKAYYEVKSSLLKIYYDLLKESEEEVLEAYINLYKSIRRIMKSRRIIEAFDTEVKESDKPVRAEKIISFTLKCLGMDTPFLKRQILNDLKNHL